MQIQLSQLSTQLNRQLAPIYLISGDAPFLIQEARDTILKVAYQAGYQHCERLEIEPHFDWNKFLQLSYQSELFNQKSCIEIRNLSNRFDQQASEAILSYCAKLPTNKLLIIISTKLTNAQQQTIWFQAIDRCGITIPIWPIAMRDLPVWIKERLKNNGLKANYDSIKLLAELTEGNLLATQQAIEKLKLLCGQAATSPNFKIGPQQIMMVMNENSRFNIFELANYALQGDRRSVLRVLHSLRGEGIEAISVLWILTRELRTLFSMKKKLVAGISMAQVLNSQWQIRKPYYQKALNRLEINEIKDLLQFSSQIDFMIKGLTTGNAWDEIIRLGLNITGAAIFNEVHYPTYYLPISA